MGVDGQLDRRERGRHQDTRVWRPLFHPLQRFETVEPGHLLVEHDRVVRGSVAEPGQPLVSARRFIHLVSRGFERQAHHLPDVRLIVDDQKLHGCASSAMGMVNVNVDPLPGED